jgi:tRNA modification GTPase
VDTAGIRDARDEIERRGVDRSLESIEEADIVIALFDSSREYDEAEDGRILRLIERFEKERLIVALNKSDLPGRFDKKILAPFPYIEISAKREFARLMSELEKRLDGFSSSDELMLVNERQMDAVRRCAKQIEEAREPLRRGELEIFSYHLAEAASAIGEISRPYESEEILDRMFSEFCLGK